MARRESETLKVVHIMNYLKNLYSKQRKKIHIVEIIEEDFKDIWVQMKKIEGTDCQKKKYH